MLNAYIALKDTPAMKGLTLDQVMSENSKYQEELKNLHRQKNLCTDDLPSEL
jgi:hypothetical protein